MDKSKQQRNLHAHILAPSRRKLFGRLGRCLASLLLLAATCNAARAQAPDRHFVAFFRHFKAAVRANDVARIADSIHFPFYVYSSKHTRKDFVSDRSESVNFFNRYVRGQIQQVKNGDVVCYGNKQELGEGTPDFSEIPPDSPVFEVDIVRQRGGPAMRLIFAKAGSSYKLFCLTE